MLEYFRSTSATGREYVDLNSVWQIWLWDLDDDEASKKAEAKLFEAYDAPCVDPNSIGDGAAESHIDPFDPDLIVVPPTEEYKSSNNELQVRQTFDHVADVIESTNKRLTLYNSRSDFNKRKETAERVVEYYLNVVKMHCTTAFDDIEPP